MVNPALSAIMPYKLPSQMAKAPYYGGIGIMSAAFLFLALREWTNHSVAGPVAGAVAVAMVLGGILIAFSGSLGLPSGPSHKNAVNERI